MFPSNTSVIKLELGLTYYVIPNGEKVFFIFNFRDSNNMGFSVPDLCIYLQVNYKVNNMIYYEYLPMSLKAIGNGDYYASVDVERITDETFYYALYILAADPIIGNFGISSVADSAVFGQDFVLYFSYVRQYQNSTPVSDEERFQDDVVGGLDDINDDINKGFESIQGEISSGTDDVVDAVDGVKDSVDSVGDDIVQWGQNIVTGITEGVTNIQETIVEQTETLGNFILDGLKSLFIPSEGYFKELFDDLNEFFSDVFGFLYFPIEHVISWFNRLLTLPENEPSIAIPELAYGDTVLIEAQTYTFDFLDDEPFSTVHDYYLLAMDAAMIMGFVHLLQRKYEEVMKN